MIKIGDRFFVETDGSGACLTYKQKKISERGKSRGQEIEATSTYYYANVEQCCKKVIELVVAETGSQEGEALDARAIIDVLHEIGDEIIAAIKKGK